MYAESRVGHARRDGAAGHDDVRRDAAGEIVQSVRREEFAVVAVYADRTVRSRLTEEAGSENRLAAAGCKLREPLAGLGDRERQTKRLGRQSTIRRETGEVSEIGTGDDGS